MMPSEAIASERPPAAARRETRSRERHRVEVRVSSHSDHNFYTGLARNPSATGLFIATHVTAYIGDEVEFWIRFDDTAAPIHGVGEVHWIRQYSDTSDAPPGVGVRFLEIGPTARELVAEFVSTREPLFYDESLSG